MPRLPRLVIPGLPHHITQRGVRSPGIFIDDADRNLYLELMRDECARQGCSILAWCLMSNHVHLVVVPEREESLALGIGMAHRRYTRARNSRKGVRGHLFGGRFHSCVLDEKHLMRSARYTELNPVAAGIVDTPGAYAWSSAALHLGARGTDPLILPEDRRLPYLGEPMLRHWRKFLRNGVEETQAKRLEEHVSSGLPLGARDFVKKLEASSGRQLFPRRGGRPKNTGADGRS
jgi:putative transposase